MTVATTLINSFDDPIGKLKPNIDATPDKIAKLKLNQQILRDEVAVFKDLCGTSDATDKLKALRNLCAGA
jgi:hypothetical protein